ncbi:MAG: hypothetical protein ACK5NB_01615 [Flavobacteriaceae bacterium]
MGIIKYYDCIDFEIFIFDNYVINQIKEGIDIQPEHNNALNLIIEENFNGKSLVYISNRVNSYSVNPLIYPKMKDIPNLLAIAIVLKNDAMKKNAEFERRFFNKPYEIFNSLTQAIIWAEKMLEEK